MYNENGLVIFVEAVFFLHVVDNWFLNIVLKHMLKTHNTLENEFGFILRWKGEIEKTLWWSSYSGGLFKERAGVLACQS